MEVIYNINENNYKEKNEIKNMLILEIIYMNNLSFCSKNIIKNKKKLIEQFNTIYAKQFFY